MGTSVKDLIHLLESLGCERDKSGDHIRYTFSVKGREVAKTKYSHSWRGNMQIDKSMLSKQAKDMHCSNGTWKLLLEGKATKERYFRELLQRGLITQEEFESLCPKGK